MLNEICRELRNWFNRDIPILSGDFTIEGGTITREDFASSVQEGQYFRIVGSVFNDGVYKKDQHLTLTSETFNGAVWPMAIPREIIELDAEITAWLTKYGDALTTPYDSESFGGYSYTKAKSTSGAAPTWRSIFAEKLNNWRKT